MDEEIEPPKPKQPIRVQEPYPILRFLVATQNFCATLALLAGGVMAVMFFAQRHIGDGVIAGLLGIVAFVALIASGELIRVALAAAADLHRIAQALEQGRELDARE